MSERNAHLKSSETTGKPSPVIVASSLTGLARGEIGCGKYPLPVSATLCARHPAEVDMSLKAHLQHISGQQLDFSARMVFPENAPPVRMVTGMSWNCPPEAIDECRKAALASLRAAPEEELAKAVYRLRILTRGREQRSDADREAEAVIWIEQLRCWPGDIVLAVLRRWPGRKDGQWWPTWHDVEAELRAWCSLRMAIISFLERPLAVTHDKTISPEERAKVREGFIKLADAMGSVGK